MKEIVEHSLREAQRALDLFISDPDSIDSITRAAVLMTECLKDGGKIMSCGNGGSLCDASHFAMVLLPHDEWPSIAMMIFFMMLFSNILL